MLLGIAAQKLLGGHVTSVSNTFDYLMDTSRTNDPPIRLPVCHLAGRHGKGRADCCLGWSEDILRVMRSTRSSGPNLGRRGRVRRAVWRLWFQYTQKVGKFIGFRIDPSKDTPEAREQLSIQKHIVEFGVSPKPYLLPVELMGALSAAGENALGEANAALKAQGSKQRVTGIDAWVPPAWEG